MNILAAILWGPVVASLAFVLLGVAAGWQLYPERKVELLAGWVCEKIMDACQIGDLE